MKVISALILSILFQYQAIAGNYLEYKLSGGPMAGGVLKMWYQDKNSRSEMTMTAPGLGSKQIVTLFLAAQPKQYFLLDPDAKTYTVSDAQDEETTADISEYEFVVLGPEKVNGYNAIHVQAKSKKGEENMDWWLSKEVPGYQEMKDLHAKEMNTEFWSKGLKSKGIEGMPVKMTFQSPENRKIKIEMNLVKAEKKTVPGALFSLDGFTKQEVNQGFPGGMDLEKIKNMSPAERQKMVDEMMKKYGK